MRTSSRWRSSISTGQVDSDYFTAAIVYTQVSELAKFAGSDAGPAHGEVRVKRQVVGFKKIKFYTLENVGAGLLSLPEQEMHTTAFWLHFASSFFNDFAGFSTADLQDAIRGLGSALKTAGTVLLLSDPARRFSRKANRLRTRCGALRQLPGRHRAERTALPPRRRAHRSGL